ncbi:NADPH-dependent F420 reductase [Streptomyces hokutonensis]|uniref:NADPH-dependent F420 reductase n=1 Tax=Streptomyces hokutonensis TaxID=1306990 RepID=A0ABW6MKV4_9ACTN
MRTRPGRASTDAVDITQQTIGILGGTGPQGRGLAYRLARAGQPVVIGSRTLERAQDTAAQVGLGLTGHSNVEAARHSDIVIVTVPWEGHAVTLKVVRKELEGKLVIDSVNPLGFDSKGAYALRPEEGSAAEQAAVLLPETRVTAAFHHLSATVLTDPEIETIETDVLVLGENRTDTDIVQGLIDRVPGLRGIYAGRLRNAHQVEALVANLISINRRYKRHAGVRITDL